MSNKIFICLLSLFLLFGNMARSQNIPLIRAKAQSIFLVDADQTTDFDLYIDAQHDITQWDVNYDDPTTLLINPDFSGLDYDDLFPTEHLRMLVELSQAYGMLNSDEDAYANFSISHSEADLEAAITSGLDWWFQNVGHGDGPGWWYDEIGLQRELQKISVLFYDHLANSNPDLSSSIFRPNPAGGSFTITQIKDAISYYFPVNIDDR